MATDFRSVRRVAGMLAARLPELRIADVHDPRQDRGKRWTLPSMLNAALLGIMSGRKSLRDIEQMTADLSLTTRRQLGIKKRIPDTSLRDVLCRMEMGSLRQCLHLMMASAWRRKALEPVGLPFHMLVLDGKSTALPCWDDEYVQRVVHAEKHLAYGLMRTITCALATAPGVPCLDALPIPVQTNEMGFFQTAVKAMLKTYGAWFKLISYDAGACGEENARFVVENDKHYLLRVNDERRHMLQLQQQLFENKAVLAMTEDVLAKKKNIRVVRSLSLIEPLQTNDPDSVFCWTHTRTWVKVNSKTIENGIITCDEDRYYVSSMPKDMLTPEQWLRAVRLHWSVENNNHHILDTVFKEDDFPMITNNTQGALALLMLRRIAYSLLALFRSVTLRSADKRQMPWKDLLLWVYQTMILLHEEHIRNIRCRQLTFA